MKREFSAGGIVYRQQNGQVEFLLVRNQSLKDPTVNYWGFPKGHLEEGETGAEAAVREVEEEAGVKAEIEQKIGDSKYVIPIGEEKIFKIVTIFLMKYLSGEAKNQPEEINELGWFNPDGALKTISFSNDKQLFKKALELIHGQ